MDDTEDSVLLKKFHECLVRITSRTRDDILNEFNGILLQQQQKYADISAFLEIWESVSQAAKDLFANFEYFRLHDKSRQKIEQCYFRLDLFLSETDFASRRWNLKSLNRAISELAEQVRFMVTFNVPETFAATTPNNSEYQKWIESGKNLACDPKFIQNLSDFTTLGEADRKSRFAAIIDPSLVDKTQFAFALSLTRKVIYVNLKCTPSDDNQEIYESFGGMANLFRQALWKDFRAYRKELVVKKSAYELSFFREKLYILGLLARLMECPRPESQEENWFDQFLSIRSVKIEMLTFYEFLERFDKQKLLEYILFLDEFPINTELIVFLKNVAEFVDLPCVFLENYSKVVSEEYWSYERYFKNFNKI